LSSIAKTAERERESACVCARAHTFVCCRLLGLRTFGESMGEVTWSILLIAPVTGGFLRYLPKPNYLIGYGGGIMMRLENERDERRRNGRV
jgi:hypothetical protein